MEHREEGLELRIARARKTMIAITPNECSLLSRCFDNMMQEGGLSLFITVNDLN